MNPIFRKILHISCAKPLDGAMQMAIDELLMAEAEDVIFRDYSWAFPTISIGYFGTSAEVISSASRETNPARDFVRRPTGGGMVEHGQGSDYTYSIIVPAREARILGLRPRASYRAIHGALSQVLQTSGLDARLAEEGGEGAGGQACFVNPVGDDLLLDGKKIAGAGQKRSRGAILHQGSVQPVALPDEFGAVFAAALAEDVEQVALDRNLLSRAEALAESKFRRPEWNCRR
ncbi:MAG: lipoate--protein ligase family protein [Verrucomicrobiales bacterium]